MLIKILITLAIIPWSIIAWVSYLVYRRVRSQQKAVKTGTYNCALCGYGMPDPCKHWRITIAKAEQSAKELREAPEVKPQTYEEMKQGVEVANADYIAKIGRA